MLLVMAMSPAIVLLSARMEVCVFGHVYLSFVTHPLDQPQPGHEQYQQDRVQEHVEDRERHAEDEWLTSAGREVGRREQDHERDDHIASAEDNGHGTRRYSSDRGT